MKNCSQCGRPVYKYEMTWPGVETDSEVCQDCWESNCDKEWWDMVLAIEDLNESMEFVI